MTSTNSQRADNCGDRRPFHNKDFGGILSYDGTKLYYIGIIDILTRWTPAKQFEHALKTVQYADSKGVSCCHPNDYAERFMTFMKRHIE